MSNAELFRLEYQDANDGIWLIDPEGQGTNLGFTPTLAEVLDSARQHGLEGRRGRSAIEKRDVNPPASSATLPHNPQSAAE